MNPETKFKNQVKKDLEKLKKTYPMYIEKIQQVSIRGTPDFIICANGRFIGLELKQEKAKKRNDEALQNYKLQEINDSGGVGLVVRPSEWPRVLEHITLILKGETHGR